MLWLREPWRRHTLRRRATLDTLRAIFTPMLLYAPVVIMRRRHERECVADPCHDATFDILLTSFAMPPLLRSLRRCYYAHMLDAD